jgi:hypothetical protein
MNDRGGMDTSVPVAADALPPNWTWERFRLVDVGRGLHALYSAAHKRFVRMNNRGGMDASATVAGPSLPAGWTWEQFHVQPAGR